MKIFRIAVNSSYIKDDVHESVLVSVEGNVPRYVYACLWRSDIYVRRPRQTPTSDAYVRCPQSLATFVAGTGFSLMLKLTASINHPALDYRGTLTKLIFYWGMVLLWLLIFLFSFDVYYRMLYTELKPSRVHRKFFIECCLSHAEDNFDFNIGLLIPNCTLSTTGKKISLELTDCTARSPFKYGSNPPDPSFPCRSLSLHKFKIMTT